MGRANPGHLAAAPPHFYRLGGAVRGGRDTGGVRGEVARVGAAPHHAVGADGRVHPGGELQLGTKRRAAEVGRRGEA